NVRPAGNRSVTCTPVVAAGPSSMRVTVNVIVSPTLGRGLLTILATTRSASRGLIEAVALLLAVFGSNWSEWSIVAGLGGGLAVMTREVSVRVCDSPTARVPTVQIPVAGL